MTKVRRFISQVLALALVLTASWPLGVAFNPAYAAAPAQVQNVNATDTDPDTVTVTWDALQDPNVNGYRVYRENTRGSGTYIDISGDLTPATTQYADDIAWDDSGTLNAPDTVQASNNESDQITVTWSGETAASPAIPYNYYVVAFHNVDGEGPASVSNAGNVRPEVTRFEAYSSADATVDLTDTPLVSSEHDVTELTLGFNATRYYKARAYAASLDDDADPDNGPNGWSTLSAPTAMGVTMAEVPQAPAVTAAYDAANGFYIDVTGYEPAGGAGNYATLEIDETSGNPGGSDMAAGTNTTFRDTGLSGNTQYTYRVRALNALNRPTAWVGPVSDTTPPDAGGINMSHSANTTDTVTWDWDDVPGAVTYDAEDTVSTNTISGLPTSDWQELGLSANTLYTAFASPVDGDGIGGQPSSSHSAYTSIETPGGLSFGTVTENSVEMTANGPFTNLTAGSSGIFFDETSGAPGGSDSPWQQGMSYTDTGLQPNTSYTYRVQARNGDGDLTAFSGTQSQVTLAAVPDAPTVTSDSSSSNQVTINANGNPNGTQYEIVYDTDPNGAFGNVVQSWTAHNDGDQVPHNGLNPNSIYYYKVRARNQDAVETAYSSVSSAVTLAVTPEANGTPAAGNWQSSDTFTFTNAVNWTVVDHYHYRWNNNPVDTALNNDSVWDTSNDPLVLTAASDGEWYIHLLSHNFSHGDSGTRTYGPYRFDATDPASSADALPAITSQSAFDIAFAANDNASGVQNVKLFYSKDGGADTQYPGTFTVSPISFNSNQTGGDGSYTFYTVATDNAGNVESAPGAPDAQTVVDRMPPEAVTDLAVATTPTNTAPVLSWTNVTDAGTGVAYYRIYRSTTSGQLGVQINADGATLGTPYTDNAVAVDDTYYYTVQAVDNAGNEQMSGNNQVEVVYDTTAPTVNSFMINAGQPYTTSLTVTLNNDVTDTVGPVEMRFAIDHDGDSVPDTAWSSYEAYTASRAFTLTNYGNGAERVIAQFRDAATNESVIAADSIVYDSSAPDNVTAVNEVSGSGVIDDTWQKDSRDASFTWAVPSDNPAAPDSSSGIQNYDVYWGTSAGVPTAATTTVFGASFDPAAVPVTNGKAVYYLRLKTRDNLNFESAWSGILFTLRYDEQAPDTPAPQTNSLNGNGWSNVNDFDFYWSKPADNVDTTDYDYHSDTNPDSNTTNEFVNNVTTSEDTHIFYVRANDAAGNNSNYGQVTFRFDATNPNPPVLNSAAEGGGAVHDTWQNSVSDADFTSWGAATDPGASPSGIQDYDVYFGTSPTGNTVMDTVTSTAYDPAAVLNSGDVYYLRARARDLAGNISVWENLFTLRYENGAPTGTILINNNDPSTQNPVVNLTMTSNDDFSGVAEMRFSNDNALWSVWEPYQNSKAGWDITDVAYGGNGNDGVKTVYVEYRDNAGNVSASGAISDAIVMDSVDPTLTVNTADDTWFASTTPVIDVDFFDNVELQTVYYKVGSGGAWQQIATDIGANNFVTDFQISGLQEGANNLFFRAVDAAGHDFAPTDAVSVLVVNVDTAVPGPVNLSSSTHTDGFWSGNPNVVFNWTEPASGAPITGYRYIIDTQAGTAITGDPGETALPAGTLTTTVPAPGPVTYFHIAAVNEAGTYGQTDHFNILFDNTEPNSAAVTIDGGNPATAVPNVTLTVSATDMESGIGALSQMQFSNDGATFSPAEPYNTTKVWDLTDPTYGGDATEGVKTVSMKVSDIAGNWITVPVTDTITYDPNEPSQGTVDINAGASATNNALVNLTISSSDSGSGLANMRISNDESNWMTVPYATTYNNWNLTDPAYGGTGTEENKTVYLRFQDAAGNWSSISATDDIIFDQSAPTGGSFQVGNGVGTNQQLNDLNNINANDPLSVVTNIRMSNDDATFTDGSDAYAATYNNWDIIDPAYGGAAGDGVKTVYMQFKDAAENWSASAQANINLDTVEPQSGSFVINNGDAGTNSLTVTLDNINATDNPGGAGMSLGQVQFSNVQGGPWSPLEPYTAGMTKANWDLSAYGGDTNPGTKTVYAQFRDSAGNISVNLVVSDDITYFLSNPLDHFAFNPAIPAQLAGMQVQGPFTVEMQDNLNNPVIEGADRTVYLYTDSATGAFDTSAGGAFDGSVTSIIIPNGQSTATFYYRDNAPAVPQAVTLTASDVTPLDDPDAGVGNAVRSATIEDLTAPTFAGVSGGAADSETQITIQWNEAADDYTIDPNQITYNIYRATVSGGQDFGTPTASVTTASPNLTCAAGVCDYVDTGLTPATQYFYVVRAADTAATPNEDTNTNEVMVQTPIVGGDVVAPTFGGVTSATALTDTRIAVSWDRATDDVTAQDDIIYEVHRDTASQLPGAGGTLVQPPVFQGTEADVLAMGGTVMGNTITLLDDNAGSGLNPATQYFYIVRARDEAGNRSHDPVTDATPEVSATTLAAPDVTAPVFAGLDSATAAGPNSVNLSWTAATDDQTPQNLIEYRIYRSNSSMVGSPLPPSLGTVTGQTTFNDPTVAPDSTYFYIIRAFDAASPRNGETNEVERSVTTPDSQQPPRQPSGGGGGGGYVNAGSLYARLAYAPELPSDKLMKLYGSVSFARSKGKVNRPIQLIDKFNNILVSLQQGTRISDSRGNDFTGILKPPYKIRVDEITTPIPEGIDPLGRYVYRFGSLEERFDKTYTVEAKASVVIRRLIEQGKKVTPMAWNSDFQKWEPIELSNILKEDGETFSVDLGRSTIILFTLGDGEVADKLSDLEKEDGVPVGGPVKLEIPTDVTETPVFEDVTSEDMETFYAVQKLAEEGAIEEDRARFYPNKEVNRAEAVKMVLKAFGLKPYAVPYPAFADIRADDWFTAYAERARFLSIFPDTPTFNPSRGLTRAEAVQMLLRASLLKVPENLQSSAKDVSAESDMQPYIAFAEKTGIISLDSDGNFAPNRVVTRAELAVMISKTHIVIKHSGEGDFHAFYEKAESKPKVVITSEDLAPFTRNFENGDTDSDIARIKKVLFALGFHPGDFDEQFDDEMAETVYQFQSSIGIVPNRDFYGAGMVGNATRRELNRRLPEITIGAYLLSMNQ